MKYFQPKILLPGFLVIFSFLVYWLTKPPSILWVDSGTMLGASASLGIPNPPGFPFYVLATHVFSLFLPFLNYLTRLELFSSIFAVLLLLLVYRIILLIIESDFFYLKPSDKVINLGQNISKYKYFAAFFGAISLAFSYEFWSQSQNTEAFIFTDFFLVLFIYLILLIEKKRKEFVFSQNKVELLKFSRYFLNIFILIAFLYGLAAGANPTIAVLVPGILFYFYLNRKFLNIVKLGLMGAVFFITLAVVYAYLPIRASTWPFVNWGNPQTFSLFIEHLRGAGLNIYEPQSNTINGFTGSPVVFFQSVSHFIFLMFVEFTPFLVPFFIAGAWVLYKKNKYLFAFLASVVLVIVIYSGLYYSGNQEAWFILGWIILAILIGLGFYYLLLRIPRLGNYAKYLLFLAFMPFLLWIIPLNRSWHTYTSDYGMNLYSNLGKNALLLSVGDFTNSLGYYYHDADKYREDVTPLTANTFYVNKWYRDTFRHATDIIVSPKLEEIIQYKAYDEYNRAINQLIADNIDTRPIYATPLALRASAIAATDAGQLKLDKRFKFVPNGLTVRIVRSEAQVEPNLAAYDYKFKGPHIIKEPFYLERNYKSGYLNLLNDYALSYEYLGDWYLERNKADLAFKYYQKAKSISPDNIEIISRFGQYFGIMKNYDVSRQYFEYAIRLDPSNAGLHFNLAKTFELMGLKEDAIREYEAIISIAPYSEIAKEANDIKTRLIGTTKPKSNTDQGNLSSYTKAEQNYSFKYPNSLKLSDLGNLVYLTNNKNDKYQIKIYVYGKKLESNDDLSNISKTTPIKVSGSLLAAQELEINGFKTKAQVWGLNGITTQVYMMQKNNWLYVIKIDLQSEDSINVLNQILESIKPLHD